MMPDPQHILHRHQAAALSSCHLMLQLLWVQSDNQALPSSPQALSLLACCSPVSASAVQGEQRTRHSGGQQQSGG